MFIFKHLISDILTVLSINISQLFANEIKQTSWIAYDVNVITVIANSSIKNFIAETLVCIIISFKAVIVLNHKHDSLNSWNVLKGSSCLYSKCKFRTMCLPVYTPCSLQGTCHIDFYLSSKNSPRDISGKDILEHLHEAVFYIHA